MEMRHVKHRVYLRYVGEFLHEMVSFQLSEKNLAVLCGDVTFIFLFFLVVLNYNCLPKYNNLLCDVVLKMRK